MHASGRALDTRPTENSGKRQDHVWSAGSPAPRDRKRSLTVGVATRNAPGRARDQTRRGKE